MTRPQTNDPLLAPFALGKLNLRNRIVSTSHASMKDDGGMPGERYQAYHEEKARGGLAMTMIGGSAMVSRDSSWGGGQLDMSDDRIVPYLQSLSARIHAQGAAVMTQISHLGRRANAFHGDWRPTIAPSPIREVRSRGFPREMDRDDIDRVISDYADAAKRARDGGLDGIETLCGGHLIGQFMSPLANRRTDEFGGSLENRARFGLMVHEAIREAVGDSIAIGIRLIIDEGTEGGLSAEDGIALARMFEREGLVDFFDAIYGRMDSDLFLSEDNMPGMFQPDAPYLTSVARFRAETTLPLIHAGGIRDTATARHAIREGIVDLVGMTRAHLADPHLVQHLLDGTEDRIRPCVGASYCLYKKATCIHNAATGNELSIPHTVPRADTPGRVVVVGGGIAGLEAARVCALRGHDVLLLEAGAQAGGQLGLATRGLERANLIGLVDWRLAELTRLGVDVRMNCYAGLDDILAETPDTVFVATGGLPDLDGIDGAEFCVSTWDILSGTATPAAHVLIHDGTGRAPAPSCALRVRQTGSKVTFTTSDGMIGQEMPYQDNTGYRKRFAQQGIGVMPDLDLIRVTRDANGISAEFAHCFSREAVTLHADQIVVEHGTQPLNELYRDLRSCRAFSGKVHLLGDAAASRDVHAAVREAYVTAISA
ncbi:2,4-dienoyl-CoA reductase [Roseovarius pacificus]|uniref:2,4-dienoyl-CoA reductase n=1 Tax=Roseovarius pacificus TaxID=337701 RepID=A0A1M7ADX7_9RHOB|nr:FAD-dependent oxidoreductase [Roseovarius pacificus]GGO53573.1 N-methylproline demethylase [Roseovarius pacificus]SHL40877.1 2,4-dienoyl-CoA reductase [Roseovarius pacificus]